MAHIPTLTDGAINRFTILLIKTVFIQIHGINQRAMSSGADGK
jgi:hypothetical protein